MKTAPKTQDLSRRLDKLESAFNMLITTLDKKSVTILANSNLPKTLRKLLHEHMTGEISAMDVPKLCRMLRSTECDLDTHPSLRFVVGVLLVTIELRHSVRPRSKSRVTSQLERG